MSAYDVWDLAKRLLLEVFCTLMLALVQIDRDQLERDFLLGQHSRDYGAPSVSARIPRSRKFVKPSPRSFYVIFKVILDIYSIFP
jgi:hypothetical protein